NDSDVRSLNLLAELILSALKPEEEDRMGGNSQQVVGRNSPLSAAAETKSKDTAPETRAQTPAASILEQPRSKTISTKSDRATNSRPGLMVVLLMVIVALALGGAVWWNIQRTVQPVSVSLEESGTPSAEVQPVAPSQESEQQATASPETPVSNENDPVSAIREKLAVL